MKIRDNKILKYFNRKVTEEEISSVTEFLQEGERPTDEMNDGKAMPDYWLTVFKNANIIMKPADEPILKHLKKIDIRVEEKAKEPKQPKTATLICFFTENEHFENTELTVTINYEWISMAKNSVGTEIKWKPGKIVTTKPKDKKKSKNQRKKDKKGGKAKEDVPAVEALSFFDIFGSYKEDPKAPEMDPFNPQPDLTLVDELIQAIGDIAGEDSLYYYLDCVHDMDEFEDEMEKIIEENESDDEDEAPAKAKTQAQRKASGKSGKSGKKSKKASRKNTAEEDVKVPEEPNKEECKQN